MYPENSTVPYKYYLVQCPYDNKQIKVLFDLWDRGWITHKTAIGDPFVHFRCDFCNTIMQLACKDVQPENIMQNTKPATQDPSKLIMGIDAPEHVKNPRKIKQLKKTRAATAPEVATSSSSAAMEKGKEAVATEASTNKTTEKGKPPGMLANVRSNNTLKKNGNHPITKKSNLSTQLSSSATADATSHTLKRKRGDSPDDPIYVSEGEFVDTISERSPELDTKDYGEEDRKGRHWEIVGLAPARGGPASGIVPAGGGPVISGIVPTANDPMETADGMPTAPRAPPSTFSITAAALHDTEHTDPRVVPRAWDDEEFEMDLAPVRPAPDDVVDSVETYNPGGPETTYFNDAFDDLMLSREVDRVRALENAGLLGVRSPDPRWEDEEWRLWGSPDEE